MSWRQVWLFTSKVDFNCFSHEAPLLNILLALLTFLSGKVMRLSVWSFVKVQYLILKNNMQLMTV